jgi:peptide-methionine (S)-S-oxide reductase
MTKATFGAGCFWGVEETFRKIPGVIQTTVGYTGGSKENPTYEDVCTDRTGHAEVVDIDFDPSKVSYKKLLQVFFENHNPTTLNQQGPDRGTQYRSVVFYHSEEQKEQAEQMKKELDQSNVFSKPIVTEITKATAYYPAEEYHQRYLQKRGIDSCHI